MTFSIATPAIILLTLRVMTLCIAMSTIIALSIISLQNDHYNTSIMPLSIEMLIKTLRIMTL
jgi:hypothetical protein